MYNRSDAEAGCGGQYPLLLRGVPLQGKTWRGSRGEKEQAENSLSRRLPQHLPHRGPVPAPQTIYDGMWFAIAFKTLYLLRQS